MVKSVSELSVQRMLNVSVTEVIRSQKTDLRAAELNSFGKL
jgi:hypothetical protein